MEACFRYILVLFLVVNPFNVNSQANNDELTNAQFDDYWVVVIDSPIFFQNTFVGCTANDPARNGKIVNGVLT